MLYTPKDFTNLIGMQGFSKELLVNHFTLYQGYVTNVNKILEELKLLTEGGKTATPLYAELKRRLGWEYNGMVLHEFYFQNMTKDTLKLSQDSLLYKKIVEKFGSYDLWEKDFKAVGAMRGIGWAILYYNQANQDMFNIWVNEHDMGHLVGMVPILVLDVFEHAYVLDYGIKRSDYIAAFFKAINWPVVEDRAESAGK